MHKLLQLAVHLVNRVARMFKKHRTICRRVYAAKADLLSLLIEWDVPGVEPSWEIHPDGNHLLRVPIGRRRSPHCPFERLTPSARCKVVERIGPAPE